MRTPQGWQLVVLLIIIIVVFGAARLPNAARSLGKSMRIFKKEVRDMRDDEESDSNSDGKDTSDDNPSSDSTP